MLARISSGNRAGNVITLAEYRERYGLTANTASSSRRGRGNVAQLAHRLHLSNARQRRMSTSSSSSSDAEGPTTTSLCLVSEKQKSTSNHAIQVYTFIIHLEISSWWPENAATPFGCANANAATTFGRANANAASDTRVQKYFILNFENLNISHRFSMSFL
jgi:hypothetical protein